MSVTAGPFTQSRQGVPHKHGRQTQSARVNPRALMAKLGAHLLRFCVLALVYIAGAEVVLCQKALLRAHHPNSAYTLVSPLSLCSAGAHTSPSARQALRAGAQAGTCLGEDLTPAEDALALALGQILIALPLPLRGTLGRPLLKHLHHPHMLGFKLKLQLMCSL